MPHSTNNFYFVIYLSCPSLVHIVQRCAICDIIMTSVAKTDETPFKTIIYALVMLLRMHKQPTTHPVNANVLYLVSFLLF